MALTVEVLPISTASIPTVADFDRFDPDCCRFRPLNTPKSARHAVKIGNSPVGIGNSPRKGCSGRWAEVAGRAGASRRAGATGQGPTRRGSAGASRRAEATRWAPPGGPGERCRRALAVVPREVVNAF